MEESFAILMIGSNRWNRSSSLILTEDINIGIVCRTVDGMGGDHRPSGLCVFTKKNELIKWYLQLPECCENYKIEIPYHDMLRYF